LKLLLKLSGTAIAEEANNTRFVYEFKRTGENKMLNIFHNQAMPVERPLHLTTGPTARQEPTNAIRRNVRRDPSIYQPGDEIYDRARVIFSRSRRSRMSSASNIF
jgi:hypothetical protein